MIRDWCGSLSRNVACCGHLVVLLAWIAILAIAFRVGDWMLAAFSVVGTLCAAWNFSEGRKQ